ncbi:MAG: tetraacyldisaccharide 4-kinase [Alphaproteobacteria bacterium]|nr:tetraacyldisaccharide 4-kinase [Alphaproteobacteria bacterium]
MAGLLAPLGALYGGIAAHRLMQVGARARIPVVCVGNLTVGGAGKTPTAIAIARLLQARGARPMFLTRGYGGRLGGPVAVAPAHGAADVGDEPLLLARVAPTIVARDRAAGARAAAAAGADVIVMDDGFQNPALAKDLALIVVDGRRGLGNGKVFPAGPMRAPLLAQIARAQALLVVGEAGPAAQPAIDAARARGLPVLAGRLVPDSAVVAALAARPALAFAGIADPEKFFATLRSAGIALGATQAFPDHHRFAAVEADDLITRAERAGLALVTTEKDLARMQGDRALAALTRRATALPVTLAFDDADSIGRLLAAIRAA